MSYFLFREIVIDIGLVLFVVGCFKDLNLIIIVLVVIKSDIGCIWIKMRGFDFIYLYIVWYVIDVFFDICLVFFIIGSYLNIFIVCFCLNNIWINI